MFSYKLLHFLDEKHLALDCCDTISADVMQKIYSVIETC